MLFPDEDPHAVLPIDSRRDQAAPDAHHVSPMTARISQLREKYGLHTQAERCRSDDGDMPAGDAASLRL